MTLAFRPVFTNRLNLLAKLEWRRDLNPRGGGVVGRLGDDRRVIAAMDAVWMPLTFLEWDGRLAYRGVVSTFGEEEDRRLEAGAWYLGTRALAHVTPHLALLMDGRRLAGGSGMSRWSLAPAFVFTLGRIVDVESGYRFGTLEDPDFAEAGGLGFYATLSLRITESEVGGVAGFWRERLFRDR